MGSNYFDILAFLEEHSIPYSPGGSKNVGREFFGLRCCFCSDSSNHLGVHQSGAFFSCLKCGEKGGPAKLVKGVLDCEWFEAYREVERFSSPSTKREDPPAPTLDSRWKPKSLPIPAYFTKNFSRTHLEYLARRGFNPHRLIKQYDLWACNGIGRFRWRVVAPVKIGGNIVNFVGRDVTGKSDKKYLLEQNEKAVLPRRFIVYNLDQVPDDRCLIVEGPADVWRIGEGAVAFLGTKFAVEQAWTLFDHGIRKCFILFDPEPEAQRLARKLGAQLSGVMDSVTILEKQTPGDPGGMSTDEVIKLRREVFNG